MADLSPLRTHLSKTRRAEIAAVHGDNRRAFRAPVALQRADAEDVFKSDRDSFRQFLCANKNVLKRAKVLRGTAANVRLQKGWGGDEEGYLILADQLADNLRVQRVGVIDNADAIDGGKPQSRHESEGVKEGQNTKDFVPAIEHEHLGYLLNVRHNIRVGQHHALRIAGAAAGEDHCGKLFGRNLMARW